MKIVEKDPREPIQGTRWLRPDREADIDRQVGEVIAAMTENLDFEIGAENLTKEIDAKVAEIDKEINSTNASDKKQFLTLDRTYQESRRRTPDQLAEEKRSDLKASAVKVLEGFYNKKMAGRLAQWKTTCRLDGCQKQPRQPTGQAVQHKSRRRNHVFCPGHAGVKNMISKADYRRLQDNSNLRVVAA